MIRRAILNPSAIIDRDGKSPRSHEAAWQEAPRLGAALPNATMFNVAWAESRVYGELYFAGFFVDGSTPPSMT